MLMHCFWLLEFKFAFEFKCLIFSLNLSKFRSLEKAPDLSLLKAQPSSRNPSAKVRWRPSDSPAWFASSPALGPAAAQLGPSFPRRPAPRRFPPLAVADRRGPPVIPLLPFVPEPASGPTPSPGRPQSAPRPPRSAWPARQGAVPALFKAPSQHPDPLIPKP